MPGTAESINHLEGEREPVSAQSAPVRVESRPFIESWGWTTELLVLVFAALMFRCYVVWHTPLITKDGLLYVGIARTINHGMWLELVGDWFLFNPYPALIAVLARYGVDFEFGGQLINAVSSALAVVPIYLWCRSAFDRRIAQLTALTYAFHPVVARSSGQVLREGLYWNLMCWAICVYWSASKRGGWWRFALAGLFTTAATLTRMEGAVVFLLGGMWAVAGTFSHSLSGRVSRETDSRTAAPFRARAILRPTCQWMTSLAMFPLTLILLNVWFIPTGQGWHGCGRWMHFAVTMIAGKDAAVSQKPPPIRLAKQVELERQWQETATPPVDNLRDLARSLPVWNSLGEADPAQLRMQRFLILAEDQQRFLYFGRFCNECIEGLLFPCVICCFWGLYCGRKSDWQAVRDWPLVIYSGLLIGLLFYHLAREYILEPRYMFCLIPLVFPWSCVGARIMYQQSLEWYSTRPAWSNWRPSAAALIWALMLCACCKLWLGLDDRSKFAQREMGLKLRQNYPFRLKIAGPESLKRIAHYADADYFIIPNGDPKQVAEWLSQLTVDFVVLPKDEPTGVSADLLKTAENADRFKQLNPMETGKKSIQLFSVRPPIQQVGS